MQLIVAVDANWGIGCKGRLLCNLPQDLQYFKEKTSGHTVVMGRKTLESLPHQRGLPKRRNIVLTNNPDFSAERCETVHSIDELMDVLGSEKDDAFVIGGSSIYAALLSYCDTCWVTRMDQAFTADSKMVNLEEDDAFEMTWESDRMEDDGVTYRFTKYERKENI